MNKLSYRSRIFFLKFKAQEVGCVIYLRINASFFPQAPVNLLDKLDDFFCLLST